MKILSMPAGAGPLDNYIIKDGEILQGSVSAPGSNVFAEDALNQRVVCTTTTSERYNWIIISKDVSGYSKLCVSLQNTEAAKYMYVRPTIDNVETTLASSNNTGVQYLELPISGSTLSQLKFSNATGGSTGYIYNLWFE
ncbi:MAG: hypothetical protein J6S67_07850 [Methanobrevibacter sp.]|nr:hypothetical protein [Methanobrevibacter sp.]